jgi:hypothetical protein
MFRPHPRFPRPALPSNSSATVLPLTSVCSAPSALRSRLAPAATLCKSPQQYHSIGLGFPLFSYSYALFCREQNAKSFIFRGFRTLWQEHRRGVSYSQHNISRLLASASANSVRVCHPVGGTVFRSTSHPSRITGGRFRNFYPPASDLRHNPAAQGQTSVHSKKGVRIPFGKRGGFSD